MDQKSAVIFRVFPIWLALVGAFAEVLILYFEKRRDPLMLLSGDFFWMAPLALLTLVVSVVAVLALVARMWRHRAVAWFTVFSSSALVAVNLLILVPGMAHYAAGLLAAGIAVQVTRAVFARPEAAARLMRRSAVPIVVVFLAFAGFQSTTSSVPNFPSSQVPQFPSSLLLHFPTSFLRRLGRGCQRELAAAFECLQDPL